ncbi:hypothetical protein ACQJBY_068835 [Aegilops geniculata]
MLDSSTILRVQGLILSLGIKPHSDVYSLTVLLMDKDVAGLQFLRDGMWYNVPTVSNYTLLVNVGVTMEIMTKGIFKGSVHRVVTNSEKESISVTVFYGLDHEQVIGLITQMLNEDQQARYMKMEVKDFSRGERIFDSLRI